MKLLSLKNVTLGCMALTLVTFLAACGPKNGSSYKTAQAVIDPRYQNQLFWIKASGTPDQLNRWSYYFYDPSVPSKARLVTLIDGRVDQVQAAEFKRVPNETLIFDPTLSKVSAQDALRSARVYAADKQIKFDAVKMQLRRTSVGVAPVWQVELYEGTRYAGTVYLNETTGSVVNYQATRPKPTSDSSFANDVQNTFLGIGADLEEFFTGERTVDK